MPTGSNWMKFDSASGPVVVTFPELEESDVLGYDAAVEVPTRQDAERVAARIQSVYESLPDGERRALEMLLRQAAGP